MPKLVEAAVFDVDGMLLNTKEFIFQAYEYTLETHGHEVPDRTILARQIGRSLPDCYLAFAPEGENPILCNTHHQFQKTKLDLVTAYDGLHLMLDTLSSAGIKLAAWSSRKGNLIPSLRLTNVDKYFGAIIQGDEVVRHKPDPEGLFMALDQLKVLPKNVAMLGDAPVDIEAGKTAEVAITVGITHGFGTREELIEADPDYLVDELAAIPSLLIS